MAGQISLEEQDIEVYKLIESEKKRQYMGLELIASENFASVAVLEALGSVLTNKYSEGQPGARYYGGNEIIDKIELLCQQRALETFGLDTNNWGVNVQPYSGSPANFAVYTAVLRPNDRIMGLGLSSGGHLTHGHYTQFRKISAASIYFQTLPYTLDPETGLIDYDRLERTAMVFQPNLLICGASAYPRDYDYERLHAIAYKCNALLMCDMSHFSGLVAAGQLKSPFKFCDIVTTTTHKTLRGPRSGMIFFRRGAKPQRFNKVGTPVPEQNWDLEDRINFAVFPSCQGGPHNHQIAAVAVALREARMPEFVTYSEQVVKNARALAASLMSRGYKLMTNGTDNHLVLWDVRPLGLTGSKLEKLFDAAHITLNKNAVLGDASAMSPGGVRIGTAALTSRGFTEVEFEDVAEFLHRGVQIALRIQKHTGKHLAKFVEKLTPDDAVRALCADVMQYSRRFPIPGFDVTKYKF